MTHSAFDPRLYVSDDAAFIHYDAELVRRGVNPYTADALYWNALQRFPTVGATPLRQGTYASLTWEPRYAQIRRNVAQEIADPTTRQGEFAPASLHSYPALAFLSYVPVVWAGLGSTLLLSLVVVALLLVVIGRTVPSSIRVLGWALLLANSVGILLTLRGSFEALALIPAILAWQMMDRRWLSPTLLGLACAVKQIIWPLTVLYAVLCIRREGWRVAFARGGLMVLAFLAPNLPFALANPAAWAKSLFLPVSLPLFPDGVGLVALARAGILSLWPTQVYTALEVLALGALVLWLLVARRSPRPELVLLLGMLPLALGWRSLASYFAWLPAIALYAVIAALRANSEQATSDVMLVCSVSSALAQSE